MSDKPKTALVTLALLTVSACQGTGPVDQSRVQDRVEIEFRLADNEPGNESRAARVKDSGQEIFLSKESVLSGENVHSAAVIMDDRGKPAIGVYFTPEGADILKRVTKENIGRQLAVIVSGEVIQAWKIVGPITEGRAIVTGSFTPEQAGRYAEMLNSGRRSD